MYERERQRQRETETNRDKQTQTDRDVPGKTRKSDLRVHIDYQTTRNVPAGKVESSPSGHGYRPVTQANNTHVNCFDTNARETRKDLLAKRVIYYISNTYTVAAVCSTAESLTFPPSRLWQLRTPVRMSDVVCSDDYFY